MLDFLKHYGLPIHISTGGPGIDEIIVLTHWLMLILFVGWGSFFIISLVKFRASKNPKADHVGVKSHLSSVLEVAVAIIEIVLLIGFAFPIWASRVNNVPTSTEDGAVHIRVIAQQFAWNIHYPGADGIFGETKVDLIDEEENPIGLDRSSVGGKDDISIINQMHIPVHRKIRVDLSTKDVIHSFKLPELRVGQDVIPGMSIPVHFEATMTSEEFLQEMADTPRKGKGLEIVCAQLCGLGHYKMKGYLTIHDEGGFQAWLDKEAQYLEENEGDEWGDDDW